MPRRSVATANSHAWRAQAPQPVEEPSDSESNQSHPSTNQEPAMSVTDGEVPSERGEAGDIVKELEEILHQDFGPPGNYCTSSIYANAPNPCLSLDKHGVIGLPLDSDTAARVLKLPSDARKAPKGGKGTKTQYSWEANARKIKFNSIAWKRWLEDTALPHVCNALGVDKSIARVTMQFDKMSLIDKGSLTSNPQMLKPENEFATMLIILASEFEGGILNLEHGEDATAIDISSNSAFSTQVVAWYNDSSLSVTPVCSGYCLALTYNLLFGTSSKPTVPPASPHAQSLQRILTAWKEQNSPNHIVKILRDDHHNFNVAKILKSEDGRVIRTLQAIAQPMGFRIHLVHIVIEGGVHGNRYGSTLEYYSWEVKDFLNLEGYPVDIQSFATKPDNIISYDDIVDTEPDELDDNISDEIELEASQHHTGVILWPEELDLENLKGELVGFASTYLGASSLSTPSQSEIALAERLIDVFSNGKMEEIKEKKAFHLVRRAALQWCNSELWLNLCQAASIHTRIDLAGIQNLVEDLDFFGFDAIGALFDLAFLEGKDGARFDLAASITGLAERNRDKSLKLWIKRQQAQIYHTLRSFDVDAVTYLLTEAQRQGQTFIDEVLISQLEAAKPSYTFWEPFLLGIQKLREGKSTKSKSPTVSEHLVRLSLRNVPTFPRFKVPENTYGRSNTPKPNITTWIKPFSVCTSLGYSSLISEYILKMQRKLEPMPQAEKKWVGSVFFPSAMTALDTFVNSLSSDGQAATQYFTSFWQMALASYIEQVFIEENNVKFSASLVAKALEYGGCSDKLRNILPNSTVVYPRASKKLQAFGTVLYERYLSIGATDSLERDSVKSLLETVAAHIAERFDLFKTRNTWPPVQTDADTIALVTFFISINSLTSLALFLDRILHVKMDQKQKHRHMKVCLIPTLFALITELKSRQLPWPSEPASAFATKIIFRLRDYISRGHQEYISRGVEALSVLGEPLVQQQVLGADWTAVCASFGVKTPTTSASTSREGPSSAVAPNARAMIGTINSRLDSAVRPPNPGKRSHPGASENSQMFARPSKKRKTSPEIIDLSD